jgi:acetyl/propionyl-CoA carboxylase alpha subunit/acetyl-CoA carboxylase carboxyltransferase component
MRGLAAGLCFEVGQQGSAMTSKGVLVANRGEIAVRICRAAADLRIRSVAVFASDDRNSLHLRRADEVYPLEAEGPRAYLASDAIVRAARETGCDLLHPGYGFLAESSDLAALTEAAGLRFVGPSADVLARLGNKIAARDFARKLGVPVLAGTDRASSIDDVRRLLAELAPDGAIVVKAVAGGGGRGMRVVENADELASAYARCRSEARGAFGIDDVYAEELLRSARHVEVQIVGDGSGAVVSLGERECTLQRRHQKLVEMAPSPSIAPSSRSRLVEAAVKMASELRYKGLGTFEFLVEGDEDAARFAFIEANPRLQVEHTVTEEVTGLDLVRLQLQIAEGATLRALGLENAEALRPRGIAVQVRINAESLDANGAVRPSSGTLSVFDPPSGPGVRVDSHAYAGYSPPPAYDSLLAKVVVHSPSGRLNDVLAKARRALEETRIAGIETNLSFLTALLGHPDVVANRVTTRFVDNHAREILLAAEEPRPSRFVEPETRLATTKSTRAGARVDALDPLAVVAHGKQSFAPREAVTRSVTEGFSVVVAPLHGTVVSIEVAEGSIVCAGAPVVVMEAMKMEHVVTTAAGGIAHELFVAVGDAVVEGAPLLSIEARAGTGTIESRAAEVDLDRIRPDLAESIERHAFGLDEHRPEAVERRRKTGQRTVRENVDDLCDPGSFVEYGALVVAAQRRRRDLDDLIRRTPGDGMVAGIGRVNGELFPSERTSAAVVAYDYTVLAGTQGLQNHRKKDRIFEIAERERLPVVVFTEGGGGRPGDTDGAGVAGLDCRAFQYFARLSGLVPLVGVSSGYCFAGNAALLGCCDVVIATERSSIGMGGPAMIEGGGLGVYRPDEVGPLDVQVANGVVDVAVKDEAEAVAVAKRYLSYFQGSVAGWTAADQRKLRTIVPENRLRMYDVRAVVETLADSGSVLELRRGFGPGMVTALARVEGRPLGIVANNPAHLAGAIDPDGADKASRFMQLCDAFDLPILFLCDTPGIMVGPEVETRANVRHAARMFVIGASLTVPFFTIVLRKGYGLGAQAMAGGSFHAGASTIAWPTGEFGGMGLEGAVKLGFQKELAAIESTEERRALFDRMVAHLYEIGKAVSMASHFEIDDVIDPMDSRARVVSVLRAARPPAPRAGKKRPCVDSW